MSIMFSAVCVHRALVVVEMLFLVEYEPAVTVMKPTAQPIRNKSESDLLVKYVKRSTM